MKMKMNREMPGVCVDSTLANTTGNYCFDSSTHKGIVQITESELKAITRGDLIYEAAARVMINRGLWVLVPEAV